MPLVSVSRARTTKPRTPGPPWSDLGQFFQAAFIRPSFGSQSTLQDRDGPPASCAGRDIRLIFARVCRRMSYLSGRCHDGRRLVEEFVQDVLGVPVALGTVSAYEAEMAEARGAGV